MKSNERDYYYPPVLLVGNDGSLKGMRDADPDGTVPLDQEAQQMFAGLNKTIMTALVVGGLAWYFFLRK